MNIKPIMILLGASLLAACGNKGPLVMPQKPVEQPAPAVPQVPAEEAPQADEPPAGAAPPAGDSDG